MLDNFKDRLKSMLGLNPNTASLELVKEAYDTGELYSIYYINDKNYRTGRCKKYYKDGKLMATFMYKNDDLNGLCKRYHDDGSIEEAMYKNGGLHGVSTTYDKWGNKREIATYRYGRCRVSAKYDKHGNPIEIVNYNYEIWTYRVQVKEFYAGTNVLRKMYTRINDKLDGPYEEYYPNGKLAKKAMNKNGGLEGPYEERCANGQLKTKGVYDRRGLLYCTFSRSYDEHGNLCGYLYRNLFCARSVPVRVPVQERKNELRIRLFEKDADPARRAETKELVALRKSEQYRNLQKNGDFTQAYDLWYQRSK